MKEGGTEAVEARDLAKTYRSGFFAARVSQALAGVSLSVERGEIFGVLGPNGAGKTTLLNILSTQLIPDSGTAFVLGEDALRHPDRLRARMNMCSGNANFPWSMTVKECLLFYGMLYGISGQRLRARVEEVLVMLDLGRFKDKRFEELSTGGKQRLALAKSLINDPEILFLDEPTVGLDPDIASRIRSLILQIHREKKNTILLTTHYMAEAEMLCGRIAFLKDGKVLTLGTSQELKKRLSRTTLEEVFIELAK